MRTLFAFLFLFLFGHSLHAQSQNNKPNIIIIMADDLGWADLTCYGSVFYETPNLDRLASQGMRFTQAYATSPVCSPTRSSLMTGKYPVKTGVTDWIRGRQENGKAQPYEKLIAKPTAYQLGLTENTIAELATANGYKTFFAGKWHLGEEERFWPEYQGFQFNKGGWSKGAPVGKVNDTTGGFFTPYGNPRLPDGAPGEYLTDRLTDECLRFLENNKDDRFFLTYSLYAVHNPLQAPTHLIRKYEGKRDKMNIDPKDRFTKDERWMFHEKGWRRRVVQDNPVYAAMIENMDTNIGRILNKLNQLNIDDETLIVFTSDNGGLSTAEGSPTSNSPLRAGKGWLYEGGVRVPLIIYWQGRISAGSVSDLPVTIADLFPTLAKSMDVNFKNPKSLDGQDLFQPTSNTTLKNRPLYWHYPHYSNQGGKPGSAILQGDLKLIYNHEDQSIELYNLKADLSEKNNLASTQPREAKALHRKLMKWLQEQRAQFPGPNPNYDPSTSAQTKGQDDQ